MDVSATLGTMLVPIVVAVCLCAGYVVKNLVPGEGSNRWIPALVAALGVLINSWAAGWAVTPEVLAGGLVSGLASTGLYEAFRQFVGTERKGE